MKRTIILVLLIHASALLLNAQAENRPANTIPDPTEQLSFLEKLHHGVFEGFRPELAVSVLRQTIPFLGVFRADLDGSPSFLKRRKTLRYRIRANAIQILENKDALEIADAKRVACAVLAGLSFPWRLQELEEWKYLVKELSDVDFENRVVAFHKALSGDYLTRLFLRSCAEDLNDTPKRYLFPSSTILRPGQTLQYGYSYEVEGRAVWMRVRCQKPLVRLEKCSNDIWIKKGPEGYFGGRFAKSKPVSPLLFHRIFLPEDPELQGSGTFVPDAIGIVELGWHSLSGGEVHFGKEHLPRDESESWKIVTAVYKGREFTVIPVIPEREKLDKPENGLALLLSAAELGGGPAVRVNLALREKGPIKVVDIRKNPEGFFWFMLFEKNGPFIAMHKRYRESNLFKLPEMSDAFLDLEKGQLESLNTTLQLPWQLGPGRYRVIAGFGPFKIFDMDPPEKSYWHGHLISEVSISIESERD